MEFSIRSAKFLTSVGLGSELPPVLPHEIALVGKSNVGKSSLINALCSRNKLAKTSSTPGKTRLINYFLINEEFYLVDLPGYGYAKLPGAARKELQNVVRDYVFHSGEMVMLFVLVDCRHDIGKVDLDFLADLGENGIPFAIIFTKGDKLGKVALTEQIVRDQEILSHFWEDLPDMLVSSAETGLGRDEILDYIDAILNNL